MEDSSANQGAGGASVRLLYFAGARQAAGTASETVTASNLTELLDAARRRHGEGFATVLDGSRVWVNGEPVDAAHPLRDGDEVAVLPPVSGGAR